MEKLAGYNGDDHFLLLMLKGVGGVHLNVLKAYIERQMNPKVCKLTVLAEDVHEQKPILTEDAPGCPKELLDALIMEFMDVLSDKLGNTEVVQLNLLTDTEIPTLQNPGEVI